jgi:hypothetical protein
LVLCMAVFLSVVLFVETNLRIHIAMFCFNLNLH